MSSSQSSPPRSRASRRRSSAHGNSADFERAQLARLHELGFMSSSSDHSHSANRPRSRMPEPVDHEQYGSNASPSGGHVTHFSRPQSRINHVPSNSVSHEKRESKIISKSRVSQAALPALRSKRGLTGMLDIERAATRKDRTFAGSVCVICGEDLGVTLRGEKILQLSCAHVCHEACFYELIREFDTQECPGCDAPLGIDSSRGGNVLDISKISNLVRSIQLNEPQQRSDRRNLNTPVPWDYNHGPPPDANGDGRSTVRNRDTYGTTTTGKPHQRNESNVTEITQGQSTTTATASDPQSAAFRKRRLETQSIETLTASQRSNPTKASVPPPLVTMRSEYPTLSKSRQQQTLTCLVTVEMPEGRWKPQAEDLKTVSRPGSATTEKATKRERSLSSNGRISRISRFSTVSENPEVLEAITDDLFSRVDNWHGLDFSRFGNLRLYSTLQVGKDRHSWQELECYLFQEMLICVKEKRLPVDPDWDEPSPQPKSKCTLKGSIMIKRHLNEIDDSAEQDGILTLNLSVEELPSFHLQFPTLDELETWRNTLIGINSKDFARRKHLSYDQDTITEDEDDADTIGADERNSGESSYGPPKSVNTAPTEYSQSNTHFPTNLHIPIDIVAVLPVSASMHGVKISILRDTLRFLIQSLGEYDRLGLVTYGSGTGAVTVVGMTGRSWRGWSNVVESVRASGQKSHKADFVESASVAMDIIMQRKSANPIASILLISDTSSSESDSIDFVVSRAEAAQVPIHCFGLGLTHKPDALIELSSRSKASYTYAKDWMMLRECVAGCVGSLQSTTHRNVKVKLRLPDGSPGKFVKVSGALHTTKRANGRDVEAALGDLRVGDKRDLLVQLAVLPNRTSVETVPNDPWENMVSNLEELSGATDENSSRATSIEEVPILQADLTFVDVLKDGVTAHLPRPSLLAITLLNSPQQNLRVNMTPNTDRPLSPSIPPDSRVVQRRMELLTSDMLTRALTLVGKGQHERAHHLLRETRTILRGLGKGGLPPVPSSRSTSRPGHPDASSNATSSAPSVAASASGSPTLSEAPERQPPSPQQPAASAVTGMDNETMAALDFELEASLEWIRHPAVFGRDSRKAVLQAIGVITSQRAYTYRTALEALFAQRVSGVRLLNELSREWREAEEETLAEESS